MAYNVVEYWRGLEELRPLINGKYEMLDPEAFYVGRNGDIQGGDMVEPGDLNESTKKSVLTYDSPFEPPVMRELFVGMYDAILLEVY